MSSTRKAVTLILSLGIFVGMLYWIVRQSELDEEHALEIRQRLESMDGSPRPPSCTYNLTVQPGHTCSVQFLPGGSRIDGVPALSDHDTTGASPRP